jgi:hypothetical protein
MNVMERYRIGDACALVLFLVFGCVFVAGCGGPTLYPVGGDVVVEDKPLAKGTVVFWPDAEKGNTFSGHATGAVENGKYQLNTTGSKGVPAGWYKVTVNSSEVGDSAKPDAIKNPVPPRFREAAKTPLRIEVVASPKPGDYNLKASGS